MNQFQNNLYWRRWSAVVRANDWRSVKGRMLDTAVAGAGLDGKGGSPHHARVWQLARQRAAQQHRAVVPDDLRHACHIHALGKDMSHLDMPNSAFSRLLCLWGDGKKKLGLLIEPTCLESDMHWNNRQLDAQKGVAASLRNYPEALVRSQADHQFHRRDWEHLAADQQLKLLMTLKQWKKNQERRFAPRPAAGAPPMKLEYIKKGSA